MKLKADGMAAGWYGVIYRNDDPSREVIWTCRCTPPHRSLPEARLCAKNKLNQLKGRK